jgi:hypothetical protein
MTETVTIESTVDRGRIEISNYRRRIETGVSEALVTVRIENEYTYAQRDVLLGEKLGSLIDLFAYLEENSRGWEGQKTAGSVDEDFNLAAKSDKLGHCYLKANMTDHLRFDTTIYLVLETAQYEQIHEQLNNFFSLN